MKRMLFLLVLIPQVIFGQKKFIAEEIKPLVDFIEQTNASPVDYVMELFEMYDVVLLGERAHTDMTQYDLIQQIISDPRFIAKVGHVFTEIGVYNMTDELNTVLKGTFPHDTIFDMELVRVIYNMDFYAVWDKTNYTKLMKDVYLINKDLPVNQKVSVTPTGIPFSWREAKTMTGEEFEATVGKMWEHKDLIMGNNAINELYKIFNGSDMRKKALIIYNMPHSCRYFENYDGDPFFAYQIIADRFSGRVANVMLNWARMSEENNNTFLSNDGKLDAAFAACAHKSIGFDLAGSPFGEYFYDIGITFSINNVKMKDVYHGFIYYIPVYEWVGRLGVPNLDKIVSKDELVRRHLVFANISTDEWEKYIDNSYWYHTTVRDHAISNIDKTLFYKLISQYFKFD